MKYRTLLLAGLLAVVTPAVGQNKSIPAKAKAVNDRLARESDVQTRVSEEMAHLIKEFGELVNDVQSNHVFAQADGSSLEETKKVLGSIDKVRVRVAASELRKAIDSGSPRAMHVKQAATHVTGAKIELTNLLRQANALMLVETIGQEIQDIIGDQRDLSRRTAQAGREKLQEQPLSTDPAELAQQQLQIARRVKKLKEALQEALGEELTDEAFEKLQKAQKIAEEKQLEEKEQKAVDDLDNEELPEAFEEQQQILEVLTEMADKISDVQSFDSDAAAEALNNALEAQTALREKTESLSPEDFKNEAPSLQLDQLNLAKDLPLSPYAAAEKAAAAMAEAASNLEKTAQEAAVAAQMEAEAALGAAMEEAMGPGPGVPGAKGEAGTDDKGDGDSDKDEEGRGNMGKGKKGKGKKPGPPNDNNEPNENGEPNEDGEPSENAAIEPVLAQNKPGRINPNPKPGERTFEKTKVEGRLPAGTDSTWSSLSGKQRNALSENFARELPREYRDMLKVYYEELAK